MLEGAGSWKGKSEVGEEERDVRDVEGSRELIAHTDGPRKGVGLPRGSTRGEVRLERERER